MYGAFPVDTAPYRYILPDIQVGQDRQVTFIRGALLAILLAVCGQVQAQPRGPLILAAASLQEALTDAGNAWVARRHARPVLSFAASSALARQVEAGAPADLFLSADDEWMNHLAARHLVNTRTRAAFLSNRLVLIAPAATATRLAIRPGMPIAAALRGGRLAIADPDAVPAGRYARTALTRLGVWPSVQSRIARAENVRAAMALVERGAAPLGIVYATDARASRRVRVLGTFPAATHPPITYPLALLSASRHPDAEAFRRFLLSREGKAIFARRGFLVR